MIRCPNCKGKTKVVDTRHSMTDETVFRQHKCLTCGYLCYTGEFLMEDTEEFRREWLDTNRAYKYRYSKT